MLPVPGSTNNRISAADQATIVAATLAAKRDYYDKPAYPYMKSGAPAPLPLRAARLVTSPAASSRTCRRTRR
jgi:hypothetical protein